MVRVGTTDLFYYSARLLPNARISYVFKRQTDAIRDPHNPLGTETLIFDADREFSTTGRPLAVSELRMPEWELPRHLREPDPAVRGRGEGRAENAGFDAGFCIGVSGTGFVGADRASTTSAAPRTSVAPSRISMLQPEPRGSNGCPGTANTSRP